MSNHGHQSRENSHLVSNLSCSPSESMNDTALPSKMPLRNVATEQNPLVLVPSIQHCKASKKKDLSLPAQGQKSVLNGVTASENTSGLPTTGRLFWKTFSPFKRSCCHGVTSGCYQLITTRIVVEPLAILLFPTLEDADSWTGDLNEKRLRLRNSGYYAWAMCLFDVWWSADLAYHFLVERIKMLWP